MQGMPITVIGTDEADPMEVRTASGHRFSLPRAVVPDDRGPNGDFELDLERVAASPMSDDVRHRMSRALINELMTASTETI